MKDRYIFIGASTVVVCVLIFLFGYKSFSTISSPVVTTNSRTATLVPFTKLVQGTQSKIPVRTNYIITSNEQLDLLWKMIDATSTPPAVDFKTNAIIAVFAGNASDAAITVAKVEDTDTRLVSINITTPDSTCVHKSSGAPYEIVAVPTTSLEFAHEDISSTTDCPK